MAEGSLWVCRRMRAVWSRKSFGEEEEDVEQAADGDLWEGEEKQNVRSVRWV